MDNITKKPVFDSDDCSAINWCGWRTTWGALRKSGWEMIIKPAYLNWGKPKDSAASRDKVYIRHPINKMMGRITLQGKGSDYDLDFLIQECNHRIKPLRICEDAGYTPEDIQRMMEVILALQESVKPKRRRKPDPAIESQAEILLLRA